MAEKSRGNSRDKKGQDQKGKARGDAMKDLPSREAKADEVKGGRDVSSGQSSGKRQHGAIRLP